jgi:hypothetical protein
VFTCLVIKDIDGPAIRLLADATACSRAEDVNGCEPAAQTQINTATALTVTQFAHDSLQWPFLALGRVPFLMIFEAFTYGRILFGQLLATMCNALKRWMFVFVFSPRRTVLMVDTGQQLV